MKLSEQRRAQQFAGGIVMTLAQVTARVECSLAIAIPGSASHASNWSVTFAMALTTTTGFCPSRPLHNRGNRSIALASPPRCRRIS